MHYIFDCWRSPSKWNSLPNRLFIVMSLLMWILYLNRPKWIMMVNEQNWFVWSRMKWTTYDSNWWVSHLRTIGSSLKGKLPSSLAFHRNMWIALLMFFSIGRFVQDGFIAYWQQVSKCQELKFAIDCRPATRMKQRNFLSTSWLQLGGNTDAGLLTWILLSVAALSLQHSNIWNPVKQNLEVHKRHFAATWQHCASYLMTPQEMPVLSHVP